MAVLRIVADLGDAEPAARAAFYARLLGMETAMDMGWIVTLESAAAQRPQITFARDGGSGAPLPALSIEVDDFEAVLARARSMGAEPVYGPVDEPWGVRRFFLRDPADLLVNILTHRAGPGEEA